MHAGECAAGSLDLGGAAHAHAIDSVKIDFVASLVWLCFEDGFSL